MGISPRFFRAAARPTPPRRLRILYWCALALIACLLVLLHISIAGEQRLAHALTVETRAAAAAPRVIVLRVPPTPRAAIDAKTNIRRADAPTKEK